MFFKATVILLAWAVLPILGQYIHDGECPSDVEVVKNYDLDRASGKWFEMKRYELQHLRDSECNQGMLTKTKEGLITVKNSSIKKPNTRAFFHGTAVFADPTADPQEGKLIISMNGRPAATIPNYWILDTDYDNYSIVWNCMSMGHGKIGEFAWIMSRKTSMDPSVEEKVNAIVEKYLKKDQLRTTKLKAGVIKV